MLRCCATCGVVSVALAVACMVIVGNHGPVLPVQHYFPSGGLALWPAADAYSDARQRALTWLQSPVSGHVVPGFEGVRDVMEQHFAGGWEVGSSVTVYVGEEKVVDLYGGAAVPQSDSLFGKSVPFTNTTLTTVFSSTKVRHTCWTYRQVCSEETPARR